MIPEQIAQYPLIRVCHPDCQISSHGDCNSPGKRPVTSVDNDKSVTRISKWIEQGGNYGVVARASNDLVVLDSDSDQFTALVRQNLPPTFTVQTGSGSFHYYYEIPEYNDNESFKRSGGEFGSVRAKNYQAVGPGSVHPETGQEYRVHKDKSVIPIPEAQIRDFVDKVRKESDREARAAAGGGSGSSGGGAAGGLASRNNNNEEDDDITAADLTVEPTEGTLQTLGFINSDSRRRQVAKVIDARHPSRRVRSWAGGFLFCVCGLTQSQIETLLRQRADWAKDNGEITRQVGNLLDDVVENSRADESVNLSKYLPNDSGNGASRTRDSPDNATMSSNGNSFDYSSIESLVVYNANSPEEAADGDRVIKAEVTNMAGRDEDGERVDTDFVSISKGTLRDNGEFGVTPQFPQDNKSVGAADADDLRLISEALNQLADKLDE